MRSEYSTKRSGSATPRDSGDGGEGDLDGEIDISAAVSHDRKHGELRIYLSASAIDHHGNGVGAEDEGLEGAARAEPDRLCCPASELGVGYYDEHDRLALKPRPEPCPVQRLN
ncbi:MAG TPA: hypothetical protein VI197_32055 [Polyangiaceae bacterium]